MKRRCLMLVMGVMAGWPREVWAERLPDLYTSGFSTVLGAKEVHAGDALSVSWLVANNGTMCIPEDPWCVEVFGPAYGPWTEAVLLSQDAVADSGDILLGTAVFNGVLAPYEGHRVETAFVVPVDCPAGQYRVLVYADYVAGVPSGVVVETDEGNNCRACQDSLMVFGRGPRTITVDDDGPADFDRIQEAIDDANDGDTIIVAEGLYREDLAFRGKNIVLASTVDRGWSAVKRTVIDGSIQFAGTEGPECVLRGFKVHGSIAGFDWQVDPEGKAHTQAAIERCILEGIVTGCGGVIRGCDGLIRNCIVADTSYLCDRIPPVAAISGCHGVFENCTFVRMHDGLEVLAGGTTVLRNCILREGSTIIVWEGAAVDVSYCSYEGGLAGVYGPGRVEWGPGNIDVNSCFVRSQEGESDYHLCSQAGRWDPLLQVWTVDDVTSRCIDMGDPNSDLSEELWPNGGRVNMGAYGGTAEASLSLSRIGMAADFDADGVVDFKDVLDLADMWLAERVLLAEDIDRGGRVDFLDWALFVQGYEGQPGMGPFEVVLGKGAGWTGEPGGYDEDLPGYRVTGGIASLTIAARVEELPDELVLAIRTSPGMPPRLEGFELTAAFVKLRGAPFGGGLEYLGKVDCSQEWQADPGVDTGQYVQFEVVGDEVHVRFTRLGVDLLRTVCGISWIDWYR